MDDHLKLKALASNPENKTKDVREALGYKNDAAFYYALNRDAVAKNIFQECRLANKESRTISARRAKKRTPAKGAVQNGHARMTPELLRKIKHEFEHISLYQQVSEFFDPLAKEIAKL